MNFEKTFIDVYKILIDCSLKSRREGLLTLEETINNIETAKYPILQEGLRLVINGTDSCYINSYYDNIIRINFPQITKQRLLIELMKLGVISIQEGSNPRLLNLLVRSLIPLKYKSLHSLIRTLE